MHTSYCLSLFTFSSTFIGLLAQYGPAADPQYAAPQPQYEPSSFGRTLGGGRTNFPVMAPLSFPTFNMMQMKQQQNSQGANQHQGSAASTGDVTADAGDISGGQTSNFTSDKLGSLSTSGSQGQCQGIHCNMNGASQVGTQGQFQKQKQTTGTFGNLFQGGFQNGPAFGFGNFNTGMDSGRMTQLQSQFQNSGASVGTGSVDKGAVNSKQDTKAQTNKAGTSVLSTSIGQGYGDNILTSGATQAKAQGQVAKQTQGQNSGNSQSFFDDGSSGIMGQNGSQSGLQSQSQAQSEGSGAATGESGAKSGTAQSAQNSVVNTDGRRTSVNSESIGTASGTGIHVSGAVTAGGNSQSQSMKQLDLSQFDFGGLARRPDFARQQPTAVGSTY